MTNVRGIKLKIVLKIPSRGNGHSPPAVALASLSAINFSAHTLSSKLSNVMVQY